MKGYVTWVAVAGYLLLAAVDFIGGNVEAGLAKVGLAVAFFGIGRKIEKGV